MKTTFTAMGEKFQTANAGTKVTFNFAGSSDLVTQLQSGAKADVFASADTKNMDKAAADNLVDGSPGELRVQHARRSRCRPTTRPKIATFADLAKPGVNSSCARRRCRAGRRPRRSRRPRGITLKPVSEESSVTDVLNKVTSGEADAGLVYVTDVRPPVTRSPA